MAAKAAKISNQRRRIGGVIGESNENNGVRK
jgi:hypothetical protein